MSGFVIAIVGPSGSGKSLFANTVCEEVRREAPDLRLQHLKEDAYYRDQSDISIEERAKVNYDHPAAIEQELLVEHLAALRDGKAVQVPRYDYAVHNRMADREAVEPAPIIIVEGILLLTNPSLRRVFDMCFYMDTPLDVCLMRRIERDTAERGRSLESVLTQYRSTVRPMYQQFILPSAVHADMLIPHGGRNRVALELVHNLIIARARNSAR